ncbi:hypothetical protein LP7551_04273 [Roseibium album]|nr:hypothetical protein LP7551_04273 [Roseibium album]
MHFAGLPLSSPRHQVVQNINETSKPTFFHAILQIAILIFRLVRFAIVCAQFRHLRWLLMSHASFENEMELSTCSQPITTVGETRLPKIIVKRQPTILDPNSGEYHRERERGSKSIPSRNHHIGSLGINPSFNSSFFAPYGRQANLIVQIWIKL